MLDDIQINLNKKNASFNSTITRINTRVDNLDSVIKTTTSFKEKADKLLEMAQLRESKQKAEVENELSQLKLKYGTELATSLSLR